MNQILSTNDKDKKNVIGIKPIVRFFAVVLIIVSGIFIAQSGTKLYSSIRYKKEYPRAKLTTEQIGSVIKLNFDDEIVLSRIEYKWNNGNITVLKNIAKRQTSIDIDIPQGENELSVCTIDTEGNKTQFKNFKVSFSEEDLVNDKDKKQPIVSIEKSSTTKKIIITVKDDRELDYFTYNWEGEEPVTIKATEETKTSITQEITVEKGTRVINVIAYDKAGNKGTKSLKIVGSNGPKVSAGIKDNSFVVKVTSDNEITKIIYTHNNEEKEVKDIPKGAKEFEFKVPLKDGENYLKVNAFENDIMTEYKCKKTK